MSNLVSHTKRASLLLLGCLIIQSTIVSCRKKIDHVPGKTVTIFDSNGGSGGSGGNTWNVITASDITNVNALEVFNNSLYFGGTFESTDETMKYLGKMDASGNISDPAVGTYYFDGILDLHVYNNYLLVAGNYSYYNTSPSLNVRNLARISTTGTHSALNFCAGFSERVRCLADYNGGLIVGGYFNTSADNSVVTQNIDLLAGNFPQGMGGQTDEIYAAVEHNGEAYVANDEGLLKKWNGSTWETIGYNSQTTSDEIYDICSFNGELYIFGKFWFSKILKKMDASGTWSNVASVSAIGTLGMYGGLKVVDGELYLYGNGLTIDGNIASNVMKLGEDNVWESIGNMTYEVHDIALFNNKLYAATNLGVHEF